MPVRGRKKEKTYTERAHEYDRKASKARTNSSYNKYKATARRFRQRANAAHESRVRSAKYYVRRRSTRGRVVKHRNPLITEMRRSEKAAGSQRYKERRMAAAVRRANRPGRRSSADFPRLRAGRYPTKTNPLTHTKSKKRARRYFGLFG